MNKNLSEQRDKHWWGDFWQGVSTEFIGAVVTTLFLSIGVLVTEQYQAIQNRKDNIVFQLSSSNDVLVIEAIRISASEGWLYNGSFRGKNLANVNFYGTRFLARADLQAANLSESNLQGTGLRDAKLENTTLQKANLQGAILTATNLHGANLTEANLARADLTNANLSGANLTGTNLQAAFLKNVIWDSNSILPDGTQWTPDSDLTVFGVIGI